MQLGEQLERLEQKLAAEQAARYLLQHEGRSGRLAMANGPFNQRGCMCFTCICSTARASCLCRSRSGALER